MFGLVSFLGAFLLFFIEPFIGKVVTPGFGGGSQVWITCMLFFQAAFLGGYGYAHLSIRFLKTRSQVLLHGALLLSTVGFMALGRLGGHAPLVLGFDGGQADPRISVVPLLALLSRSVGLPMLVLSATAPLCQAWFSRSFVGRSPYHLYAASNAGSWLGLLIYPFAAERWLSTAGQGGLILALTVVFGAGILALGWRADRALDPPGPMNGSLEDIPGGRPWLWLLASAVGSALLLATTNVLTTEVAAIPLLWILPLMLYLATFVLIFNGRSPWNTSLRMALWLMPMAFSVVLVAYGIGTSTMSLVIAGCACVVFFGCMTCHGYLYELRPGIGHLTAYYLMIAVGGLVGGASVALVAPLVFNRFYEFGIACLLVGVLALSWLKLEGSSRLSWGVAVVLVCLASGGWSLTNQASRPGRFYRDFFGTIQVATQGEFMLMKHGHTIHGAAWLKNPRIPMAYYAPPSGIGRALLLQMSRKAALKVGVVGLGVGSVANYGRPGDAYTFYEISPKVIALSGLHPTAFPILRDARCRVDVQEGDGRALLARELAGQGSKQFDVLLIDAFSGDAVPWHLLTLEACQTYLAHLAPGGILAIHVSSPLAVDRVALTNARALELYGLALVNKGHESAAGAVDVSDLACNYILLAKAPETLDHPMISETAVFQFGPGIPDKPAHRKGIPVLNNQRPWRDGRNSLSDLLFERPAF